MTGTPRRRRSAGPRPSTGSDLYDFLAVDVQFRDLVPGDYQWLGLLLGTGGCHVADAKGEGRLDGSTPATFYFTGSRIRSSGCDGPYTLTNVYLVGLGDQVTTSYFDNLHTTAPYRAAQFDTTPLVFGAFDLGYSDPDHDGVRNSLVISATVAAIDHATQEPYDWRGSLSAPDGALIETVTGRSQLYVGKTIAFAFSGAAIAQAGLDGPYTLRNVTISPQSVPSTDCRGGRAVHHPGIEGGRFRTLNTAFDSIGTCLPRSPHGACGVAVRPHASAAIRARGHAPHPHEGVQATRPRMCNTPTRLTAFDTANVCSYTRIRTYVFTCRSKELRHL